ncbi:2Fe-2S iron-sulfur cluster binding domain-containing protein [Candidatus Gracilibacteria bacterium]|nr:2Fe-2S iron-sulfur cluster binding domain-containing protein [Candidatus Gracilibacteria bacterium]
MPNITVKNASGDIIKAIDAQVGKTLLSQLNANDIQVPSACHAGVCGACMCRIESGESAIQKDFRSEPGFPLDDSEVMTCIASVKENENEDITLVTLD